MVDKEMRERERNLLVTQKNLDMKKFLVEILQDKCCGV